MFAVPPSIAYHLLPLFSHAQILFHTSNFNARLQQSIVMRLKLAFTILESDFWHKQFYNYTAKCSDPKALDIPSRE
jgi:hypothetical protein